jgi:hypothetical protein
MSSMNKPAAAATIAIVGGGPAGLMAAEVLSEHGVAVHLYDAMPSVGRKFLLAGKGGMNLTHAEARDAFLPRYGARRTQLEPLIEAFDADALRAWVHGLGIETFVGTSNRVFPKDMKAAPLLRAWLHRLRDRGVQFHMRHRWRGWREDVGSKQLVFDTPDGERIVDADAVVLALGGGSWARLGSDGAWVPWLEQKGVQVAELRPSNCGFEVNWSEHFRSRFAGHPVKPVVAEYVDAGGVAQRRQGEFVISSSGVEGSLIYALSSLLREQIAADGSAVLRLDLAPGRDINQVTEAVDHPRGSRSMSSHLQSRLGLRGVKVGLLRECATAEEFADPARLAGAIKSLPVVLTATRPIDEAISSAGGVAFEALDSHLMIKTMPGVFCAGEMLDWEAPTGGYLLTACFASGRAAGLGVLEWLREHRN